MLCWCTLIALLVRRLNALLVRLVSALLVYVDCFVSPPSRSMMPLLSAVCWTAGRYTLLLLVYVSFCWTNGRYMSLLLVKCRYSFVGQLVAMFKIQDSRLLYITSSELIKFLVKDIPHRSRQ